MYESIEYARSRLVGSVISIKNRPCTILSVDYNRELFFTDLVDKEEKFISMDSKEVDLTPIALGYMNFRDGAVYACRIAKRRWKQGIDKAGAMLSKPMNRGENWVDSKEFLACYYNEYPAFEDAYTQAKESGVSVAFHKKWAINGHGELFYRGKFVGTTLKLKQAYAYLEQMMKELT